MTKAVLLTGTPLDEWAQRFTRGEVPSAMPYGVDVLATRGWRLAGGAVHPPAWARKGIDFARHRLGLEFERVLGHGRLIRGADVALALLEREGELYGTLRHRRVRPYATTPLIVWSCWLADDIARADARGRSRIRAWLRGADLITHLSRHEHDIYVDLGVPADRLYPVTYGVSHRYYYPDPGVPRDLRVLAVGQDRGRDYATLLEAVRGTGITVDLVAPLEKVAHLDVPANVRLHGTVPLPAYRALLRRAQVVAVPTRDMAYPTGSSVALEAAASGCAVVVTGTRAMRDYFAHDDNAHLIQAGDVDGWRDALVGLTEDPHRRERLGAAARDRVVSTFNADRMWGEVADVAADRGLVSSPGRIS